jgi:hypothetical protein
MYMNVVGPPVVLNTEECLVIVFTVMTGDAISLVG